MQALKGELDAIKTSLQHTQSLKRENDSLRQEIAQLKTKLEETERENRSLKGKSHEIESIITVGESASRV